MSEQNDDKFNSDIIQTDFVAAGTWQKGVNFNREIQAREHSAKPGVK